MLFDGQELREIIGRTPNEMELRNEHGRCCRILSRAEALALDLDLFVGIGNRRRIRFLRWRTRKFMVNSGSRTTAASERRIRSKPRPSAHPGTPASSAVNDDQADYHSEICRGNRPAVPALPSTGWKRSPSFHSCRTSSTDRRAVGGAMVGRRRVSAIRTRLACYNIARPPEFSKVMNQGAHPDRKCLRGQAPATPVLSENQSLFMRRR